jgi:hypothetical protein
MKSSIACLVLAAGVSAQVPVTVGTPYYGFARAPAMTAEQQAAAALPAAERQAALQAEVAGVRADFEKTQAAAAKAQAAVTKADMASKVEYYQFLGGREGVSADQKKRYSQYAAQLQYEMANTGANAAYEAFVANPSRITSLASSAASNSANINLMKVFNGGSVSDGSFGQAGSYAYQGAAAGMEIAEDNLKAAERGLGFNDDSKAYFAALDSYKSAERGLWEQTFDMQGKTKASTHMSRAAYVRNYNAAYNAYNAKEPTVASNEAMDLAERSFTAQFLGYLGNNNIERYMDYTSAATKAAYAKRDAEKILPAFVERNRGFSQMASLELQGQASQLQGQLQAQQQAQFQQPRFVGGR